MDGARLIGSQGLYASERFRFGVERFATPAGAVERPIIRHPGSVAVLARPAEQCLLMVRQWRYAQGDWTLEIPAGTRRQGEDPLAAAGRELEEETGFAATSLHEVLRVHLAPGLSDELMVLYRAEGLRKTAVHPDPGELVGPEIVTFEALDRMLAQGRITDAKTLVALALIGLFPVSGPGTQPC